MKTYRQSRHDKTPRACKKCQALVGYFCHVFCESHAECCPVCCLGVRLFLLNMPPHMRRESGAKNTQIACEKGSLARR